MKNSPEFDALDMRIKKEKLPALARFISAQKAAFSTAKKEVVKRVDTSDIDKKLALLGIRNEAA